MTLRQQIEQNILKAAGKMDGSEHVVAQLLISSSSPVTQNEIARWRPFLGAHPKWERHMPDLNTTTRKVRAVINSLRIKHGIAILASSEGYWLANTIEEAEEFLDGMERQARAAAQSFMVTYHAMQKSVEGLKPRSQTDLFGAPLGEVSKDDFVVPKAPVWK